MSVKDKVHAKYVLKKSFLLALNLIIVQISQQYKNKNKNKNSIIKIEYFYNKRMKEGRTSFFFIICKLFYIYICIFFIWM